ncbi:cob(I)yrinic acid a,c-diamide adenosyltransferase [Vagococcus carniphilus]|uniref:cob(I)yrinic acid a,c-diamide adenosyltransferase n=1 Tax=Vagococcus carniphilus TaxID=218144 RepID=UPI003B594AE2
MKVYTKGGDKGKTSLIGGKRVNKGNLRVEAYGTTDEINAQVGLSICEVRELKNSEELVAELIEVQNYLFDCGTDLANVSDEMPFMINKDHIAWLEERIDKYTEELPKIERFILPGGNKASCSLHVARTVTRRAERVCATLIKEEEEISSHAFKFLNRLSDYFFVVARLANVLGEEEEHFYERSQIVFH